MTDREKFEAWFAPKKAEMMRNKIPILSIIREHQRDLATWRAALASQQPADDGWIEWAGGECPVDEDALVDTKWSDGDRIHNRAGVFGWHKSDYAANIIAYRVVSTMKAEHDSSCEYVLCGGKCYCFRRK